MDFKKGKFVFITLTYGAQYPAPHEAKQHLRAFLKRLSRLSAQKGRNGGFIWRLEFQDRGAPHFHIICTSLPFVPKTQIQSMWAEITGAEQPFTRIEMIRSKRGVMYYVSKYLAKTVQSGDKCSGGFIYVPYQATGSNHTEPEYDASILGRFWGVENERAIAYCEAAWFTTQSSPAFLIALKRMAAAEWLGINPYDGNGFTLYTRNAVDWFEKVLALLEYEDRWTLSRNRKSGLL